MDLKPRRTFGSDGVCPRAAASVFSNAQDTSGRSSRAKWRAALQPAPPMPSTLIVNLRMDASGDMWLLSAEQALERFLDAASHTAATLALLEGTEFHEADGGREFRLVQRGTEAIDAVGFADNNRQLKNVFGKFLNVRNACSAAGNHHPGSKIVQNPGIAELLFDQFENFFQAQHHNPAEVFDIYSFAGKAQFVLHGDALAFDSAVHQRGTMLNF